jgi:hypothetical protein
VGKLGNHEMIVPDVSRVYRRPYEGLTEQMDLLSQLFNQRRATHLYVSGFVFHSFLGQCSLGEMCFEQDSPLLHTCALIN